MLNFLLQFVYYLGKFFELAIFARIIFSWLSMGRPAGSTALERFFIDVTEPIFKLVRVLPHKFSMLDLSPIYALLFVDFSMFFLFNLIPMFFS